MKGDMDAMGRDIKGAMDSMRSEMVTMKGVVIKMKVGVDKLCDRLCPSNPQLVQTP